MNSDLPRLRTPHASFEVEHLPTNLWDLLHDLGSTLIRQHGFSPADLHGCSNHLNRTTEPLLRFLVWLQHTPEARSVLSDMGAWQEALAESVEVEPERGMPLSPGLRGSKRTSVA